MRILDVNGIEIESYDSEKGYIVSDKIFMQHHDEIPEIKEEGHYEVVREYTNGGKDLEWVVDVERQEYKAAWDEYEDICRYIEYTEKELKEFKIEKLNQQINELKQKLYTTDYVAIKIAEGSATADEYADVIEQRRMWRAQINELEKEIEEV